MSPRWPQLPGTIDGSKGIILEIRMPRPVARSAAHFIQTHTSKESASKPFGAPHEYGITADQLDLRSDGHMDIDAVRPSAILLAPVKVPGAGIYFGDMHALQGDGEIAGHTMDVSGTVTLEVDLMKGRAIE